jgi:hypothetical protein
MKTPESELEAIRELLVESEQGMYPKGLVAVEVINTAVKYSDLTLLEEVPVEISEIINRMILTYREEGIMLLISSAGAADSSELLRDLVTLLDAKPI